MDRAPGQAHIEKLIRSQLLWTDRWLRHIPPAAAPGCAGL